MRYGEPGCEVPVRALELVCGAADESDELDRLASTAASTPDAEAAIQSLGLLAIVAPDRASEFHALAADRARELTYDDAEERRVILSVSEATGSSPVLGSGGRILQRAPVDGTPQAT
jgi:hypothetical protein